MPVQSDTSLSHQAISNQLKQTLEPDLWTLLMPVSLNNDDDWLCSQALPAYGSKGHAYDQLHNCNLVTYI